MAIAVLLIWSFDSVLEALWDPILSAIGFLITAVAVLGLPYIPTQFTYSQRGTLILRCFPLFDAFFWFAAAWLLSRWVYGTGPLRSLKSCGERVARRSHV
jgi:hypothetical protein